MIHHLVNHAGPLHEPAQQLADAFLLLLQRYGKDNAVQKIDKEKKIATLASGQQIQYDALISTLPLDIMLTWLGREDWAKGLTKR